MFLDPHLLDRTPLRDVPHNSVCLILISAIIAHQLFRRYETYAVSVHLALLLGPPALLALCHAPSVSYLPSICGLFAHYAAYFAALAASVLVYRFSPFHPLARYPGPVLCRASMLWHAWITTTGEQHRYLQALHERYGNVVRIGPNRLSIRDPALVPALMGPSGIAKGPNFIGAMLGVENVPMIGIMDTDEHLRRRRAWTRGLGPGALKEYEELLAARARQLVRRAGELDGEVVMGWWFNAFSYDFMCDMAFGGGSEIMRQGDTNNVWSVIEEGVIPGTFLAQVPWLGVYISYIPFAVKSLNTMLMHGQTNAMRRLQRGSTTRDLFHYLNHEDVPDKPAPPLKQLVDDGILAIIAGADTVASALTSILYCVLTHPETYSKLRDEVDRFYPQGEDAFDPKYYREMTYLHAVINEGMRLFPPVMTSSPRCVPPDSSGAHVGSLTLPPGTSILIPPWSLHHDPHNFTAPDSFWPERWLVASGHIPLNSAPPPPPPLTRARARALSRDNLQSPVPPPPDVTSKSKLDFVHDDSAFLPFSHGPLGCVGRGLGMLEMRMVLCALVQRYEMRLPDRAGWDARGYVEGYKDYFVATRPAVPVLFDARV